MTDLLRSALIVSVLAFAPAISATSAFAQESSQPQTESEQPAPAPEGSSESSN